MNEFAKRLLHRALPDEVLDLVDTTDVVIGKIPRSVAHKEGLSGVRAVNAFLINTKGQLWIPQRTLKKRIFPGALDFSMGGFVASGESYDTAFMREVQEELRIDVSATSYRLLGKLTPDQEAVTSFMQVYEIPTEQAPNYNRADFIKGSWVYPQELDVTLKSGVYAKPDIGIVLKRFYLAT
jgi:isopentenyl-diphosphate delta-isomerase